MRQRLTRPTAALFPLVGLVAALLSSAARDFVTLTYFAYYAIQLASLCATESFRNAAACEPGVRRVDRRFGSALLCALIGSAIALLFTQLLRPATINADAAQAVDHSAYIYRMIFRATLAAALINIEHLFEERMFALGRRIDGVLLSCISNGILLADALLDANAGADGGYFALAAGLGALLSAATSYAIEPPHGFSPLPRNLPFLPRASLQTLLYPAASLAAALFLSDGDGAKLDASLPALLFGLIPWRLARTTARRTPDESRPLNLLLTAFATIPTITATFHPAAQPYAQTGTLSLICAAAIFCAPSARLYIGTALILVATLPLSYPWHIKLIPALAAIVINLKGIFLRKKQKFLKQKFPS